MIKKHKRIQMQKNCVMVSIMTVMERSMRVFVKCTMKMQTEMDLEALTPKKRVSLLKDLFPFPTIVMIAMHLYIQVHPKLVTG